MELNDVVCKAESFLFLFVVGCLRLFMFNELRLFLFNEKCFDAACLSPTLIPNHLYGIYRSLFGLGISLIISQGNVSKQPTLRRSRSKFLFTHSLPAV